MTSGISEDTCFSLRSPREFYCFQRESLTRGGEGLGFDSAAVLRKFYKVLHRSLRRTLETSAVANQNLDASPEIASTIDRYDVVGARIQSCHRAPL